MKTNIFILTIDSFLADKFHGPAKTSKTPNIYNLLRNIQFPYYLHEI